MRLDDFNVSSIKTANVLSLAYWKNNIYSLIKLPFHVRQRTN